MKQTFPHFGHGDRRRPQTLLSDDHIASRKILCAVGTLLARTFCVIMEFWSDAPICRACLLGANTDDLHALRKISSRPIARTRSVMGSLAFDDLRWSTAYCMTYRSPFPTSLSVPSVGPLVLKPLKPLVRGTYRHVSLIARRCAPSCWPWQQQQSWSDTAAIV